MMNGISKWKIVLYLAGIFAAGGVSGWVVAAKTTKEKIFSPPAPKEISSHFCERLFSKMNLSPDQAEKIEKISERYGQEVDGLRRDHGRQIRVAISNRNVRINAILTPEQRAQFEQIERERRESYRNRDRDRDRDKEKRSREKDSTNSSGKPPC
jgi:hypothetical protein